MKKIILSITLLISSWVWILHSFIHGEMFMGNHNHNLEQLLSYLIGFLSFLGLIYAIKKSKIQ